MEEFISIVPLALAIASLVGTIVSLRAKSKAEEEFVVALKNEVEKKLELLETSQSGSDVHLSEAAEKIGDHDPALVRSLYREAIRSAYSKVEASEIVYKALNDLADNHKRYINSNLKANTAGGRARYMSKIFRKAMKDHSKA
ncbi:hypothetical protein D3C77_473210 [compost metagenome]